MELMTALIALLLAGILICVVAIFHLLKKGLHEVIKGMNSFDERLNQIEEQVRSRNEPT